MMNRTGHYIETQRRARNLTRSELAELVGYRNLTKGARRITALERSEEMHIDLIDRIVRTLHLDEGYVRTLMEEDRRAYDSWLDERVTPELRFRVKPAVWCWTPLAKDITKDDAIAYAKDRARTTGFTHFLRWSRKEGVWIYPDGLVGVETTTIESVHGPCSIVGGEKMVFSGTG